MDYTTAQQPPSSPALNSTKGEAGGLVDITDPSLNVNSDNWSSAPSQQESLPTTAEQPPQNHEQSRRIGGNALYGESSEIQVGSQSHNDRHNDNNLATTDALGQITELTPPPATNHLTNTTPSGFNTTMDSAKDGLSGSDIERIEEVGRHQLANPDSYYDEIVQMRDTFQGKERDS